MTTLFVCMFALWGIFCGALGAGLYRRWYRRKMLREFGSFMECTGPRSMTSAADFIAEARGQGRAGR